MKNEKELEDDPKVKQWLELQDNKRLKQLERETQQHLDYERVCMRESVINGFLQQLHVSKMIELEALRYADVNDEQVILALGRKLFLKVEEFLKQLKFDPITDAEWVEAEICRQQREQDLKMRNGDISEDD